MDLGWIHNLAPEELGCATKAYLHTTISTLKKRVAPNPTPQQTRISPEAPDIPKEETSGDFLQRLMKSRLEPSLRGAPIGTASQQHSPPSPNYCTDTVSPEVAASARASAAHFKRAGDPHVAEMMLADHIEELAVFLIEVTSYRYTLIITSIQLLLQ